MKNYLLFIIIAIGLIPKMHSQYLVDNWYQLESKNYQGYLHYTVKEDTSSYIVNTDLRINKAEESLYLIGQFFNHKDKFLSPKAFRIKSSDNFDCIDPSGIVEIENDTLIWKLFEFDIVRKTEESTIISDNLLFVITKLDYTNKGQILEFNSMEIEELNYKKNHYLEYIKDEDLIIKGKKIRVKKITHNGEGIMESTYWLDDNNVLVKFAIDNYKIYTLIKREDVNIEKIKK